MSDEVTATAGGGESFSRDRHSPRAEGSLHMSIQHGETEAEGNQKVYSLSLPDRTGSQTFTVAN